MDINDVKELIHAYGWGDIPSKNPHMISFKKEEEDYRMNVYFTTMTITIQDKNYQQKIYKKINTLEKLEEILTKK